MFNLVLALTFFFLALTFVFGFFSFCDKKTKLQLFDFILHIFSKRDPGLEPEKEGAIKGLIVRVKR
jgi:hypothetical protein